MNKGKNKDGSTFSSRVDDELGNRQEHAENNNYLGTKEKSDRNKKMTSNNAYTLTNNMTTTKITTHRIKMTKIDLNPKKSGRIKKGKSQLAAEKVVNAVAKILIAIQTVFTVIKSLRKTKKKRETLVI